MTRQVRRWWWEYAPGEVWSDARLRQQTGAHWKRSARQQNESAEITAYVQELLPEELKYAERHEQLELVPYGTLALLVGYSLEPLFQAISVWQPQRLVLVLNERYGSEDNFKEGKDRYREVKALIERLLVARIGGLEIGEPVITRDRPEAVFRALCKELLAAETLPPPLLVDITGAKKSMDVGAFLFAAYTGTHISYVDFGEYNRKERRPYGFTCRIGRLRNPYEVLGLRRWEDVQQLYEHYHFRAAGQSLDRIIKTMQNPPLPGMFTPVDLEAAGRLRFLLQFYEAWDDGNYVRAHELFTQLSWKSSMLGPPAAVAFLGAHGWPFAQLRPQGAAAGGPSPKGKKVAATEEAREKEAQEAALLCSNKLLLTYARDERDKIERLLLYNEDYRSVLLRAIGLDELLVKARWLRLVEKGQVDVRPTAYDVSQLRSSILLHTGPMYMRRALQRLRNKRGDDATFNTSDGLFRLIPGAKAPTLPILGPYDKLLDEQLVEELVDLRNQAIHKYQSVDRQVAHAAFDLLCANLDNFEAEWAARPNDPLPPKPSAPDRLCWKDAVALCRLQDLVPLTP